MVRKKSYKRKMSILLSLAMITTYIPALHIQPVYAAAPSVITVDFDNERGPMIPKTGVMLVPNEHLSDGRILPLNVPRLRDDFDNQNILNHTPNSQPTVFEYESSRLARAKTASERLDSLGITYDPILCYVPSWMYGDIAESTGRHRAPTDMILYKQWVKDNVQYIIDNNLNINNFGVWNEYWGISKDDYAKMYKAAWEGIKEIMPDATISGPSNGKGDASDFMSYLRKNDLTIDNLSFHLLSRFSLNDLPRDMASLKTVLPANTDIGVDKIYLEEYQCSEEGLSRGNLVNWFAAMEDSGVDLALKAHWFGKGYEGFGDLVWVWNQVPNADIQENRTQQGRDIFVNKQPNKNSSIRRDTWWAMKAYAEMSGVNVAVDQPIETQELTSMPHGGTRDIFRVRALASKDIDAGEAKVLLGSDKEDEGTVQLTLNLNNRPFIGEDSRLDIYKITAPRSDWATTPDGEVWIDGNGLPQPNRFIDDNWDDTDGLKFIESRPIISSDPNITLSLTVESNDVYMVVIKKAASAPGSFCLRTPDDDVAVCIGQNPIFNWQKASGAASYDLKVATDKEFDTIVFESKGIQGETYAASAAESQKLVLGERYYWTVTANNDFGSTPAANGMYYNFIVSENDQVPGRFTMYLPANYSTGSSITPKFTWAHGYDAQYFKVQVSEYADFSNLVMDKRVELTSQENDGNMGGNHYVYKATAADSLQNDTKYYARIIAVNNYGERIMSGSAHEFTTRPAGTKPGAFSLKSVDNPDLFSMRGSLHWEESNGAFFYKLEIAKDSQFNNIVVSRDHITTNGYTLAQDELEADTSYFWRVTAFSAKPINFTTTNKKGNAPDENNITTAIGNGAGFTTENKATAPLIKAVSVGSGSGTATVFFKPVRDAAAYSIKYGTQPGVYTESLNGIKVNPGEETGSKLIKGLTNGQTYYFAITSFDAKKNESGVYNEVSATPIESDFKSYDLALSKKVYASSSEANGSIVTRPPELAVDGDSGSRWASLSSDNQWIYVDLGTTCTVNAVELLWEAAYGKTYDIQVSDNAQDWRTVYGERAGDGGYDKIKFEPVNARYVRMLGYTRGTTFGFSLYNFEVYGNYNSIAKNQTAYASSNNADARCPFDGNTDTSWKSVGTDNEWIYVDLKKAYDIIGAKLSWNSAYAEGYEIQVANYQTGPWETLYKEDWGSQESDEIFFNAVPGRYVRLLCTNGNDSYYDLRNFELYGLESTFVIPVQNIALNKPAYASSSAKREDQYPFAAVDGNPGTRWASESLDRQWIYIDLEDTYDLTSAKIAWEDSYGKRYKLQIAKVNPELESSWKDIDTTYVDNDCPGGNIEHKLSATGRYVRMQGLERSNQFGFSIWEFEIYGTPTQAVPSRKIVSFDTELSGLTVANGTKQSDLPLPDKLPVLLSDGSEEVLPLQWENVSVPAYAGDIAGEYLFSASLLLPEDGSITKDDSMDLLVTMLVTVKEGETHVESLKIKQTGIPTVSKGKKLQLDVIINPEDVANPGITWESSNPLVLTIDGNGLVTGVKAGTARVMVKAANGVSISIAVRVM